METERIPLLEHDYDEGRNAMSRPILTDDGTPLPDRCVMSFMGDALKSFVEEQSCRQISFIHSEVRDYPIYEANVEGRRICLIQAPVGAPAAAITADLLAASGVKQIVACGGCGVLVPIEGGRILIPTHALRDEGTSYHYLPPSREVEFSAQAIEAVEAVCEELELAHERCKVWTTDGFFRETPLIIERRRDEGYSAVDMECAALAAVTQAYDVAFAAVLYSGDSLAKPGHHDERNWLANMSARETTLRTAALALARGIL